MEPQPEPSIEPQRIRGKPFLAGNNANPAGRRRRKDRIAAHVQDIVVEFCARHGRKPDPSEIASIGSLALNMVNRENAPADSERSGKLSKEIRHDRKSLGLTTLTRAAPARAAVPLPTGYGAPK